MVVTPAGLHGAAWLGLSDNDQSAGGSARPYRACCLSDGALLLSMLLLRKGMQQQHRCCI